MTIAPAINHHWLANVLLKEGVAGAGAPSLAEGATVPQAWARAREVCGLTDPELSEHIARFFHLHLAGLETAESWALQLLPERVARRYSVLPLRGDDRRLVVATSDPSDLDAEQAIAFATSRTTVFEVASPAVLLKAIDDAYAPDHVLETLLERVSGEIGDSVAVVEETLPEKVEPSELQTTPVVRLTNLIIHDAIAVDTSDIHLEPDRSGGSVRFRVDGLLRPHMRMPLPALNRVISRIKIMSRLDIADRVRPQDGRCRVTVGGRAYDFRVSTVPMRSGEKAVIRILDPEGARRLQDLHFAERDLNAFKELLQRADGMVMVTGPTGSGKTSTLYAALQHMATGELNIMTVEDPIEYELPGMNQIQVAPKQGITFASALRAILRQDPDVIFIGEIRDLETAQIAVQASLTGHLVLATVHANDALSVAARLADLGVDRASIASALRGALAQLLLRRVCRHCVERIHGDLTPDEERLAARYGARPTIRASGCRQCGTTGYKGRLPVVQVWVSRPESQRLIASGATSHEMQSAAGNQGLISLLDQALVRVRQGETTLLEVDRVLGTNANAEIEPAAKKLAQCVLVADDDAVSRTMAIATLRKNGFDTVEAADGLEALEQLAANPDIALVVLDLDMPQMGGRAVLAQLRSSLTTAGLPVIVLTGSSEPEAELHLMEAGADDFIRKPLDPPRFLARVRATLRRAGGG